jgi:hypothetical protein
MIEGEDYYIQADGRWVFTAAFLLKRGFCCKSGCRHCPYGFVKAGAPPSATAADASVDIKEGH